MLIACGVPIAQNERKKKTTSSNGWFVHDDELRPVVKLPDSLFSCCPELCVQKLLTCTCTVAVDKLIRLPPPFVVVEPRNYIE